MKRVKVALLTVLVMGVFFISPAMAQTATDSTSSPGGSTTLFGITIPAWAQTIFFALITVLPAIQLVLKRIPTTTSVKIGGILGKILDVLTFFQGDITTTSTSTQAKS
jgi:hypothetical protein